MSLGAGPEALRWLREISGLTQRALAERSGVSERTIRGLERGQVRTPHQSSLLALVEAASLDDLQAAAFLRAWAPDRVRSIADLAHSRTGFTDVVAETLLQTEVEEHLVASWTRFRVRGPQVYAIESDIVVEAQRDGVDTYTIPYVDDIRSAPRLTTITSGCRLRHAHEFPDDHLTVFELGLDRPLATGESCAFTFELSLTDDPAAPPEQDTDSMLRLQHRMIPLTVVEVVFDGELPATVWEAEQPLLGALRRLRPVTPDAQGRVHLVKRYARPGSYGFEWERIAGSGR